MPDDVARIAVAVWLDDLVGEDGEDFALVRKRGGDELRLGGFLRLRLLSWSRFFEGRLWFEGD